MHVHLHMGQIVTIVCKSITFSVKNTQVSNIPIVQKRKIWYKEISNLLKVTQLYIKKFGNCNQN